MTMLRHGPHFRRHEPIRLPAWQEWSIYIVIGSLAASGLLWVVLHYFGDIQTEFGTQPHPWKYQALRVHGALAMLSLIALGSLIPVHIRRAWELQRNRVTGVGVVTVLVLLVGSGYLLYYFAGGNSRPWISTLHWALGLALLPGLGWHVWSGQMRHRSLARAEAETSGPL